MLSSVVRAQTTSASADSSDTVQLKRHLAPPLSTLQQGNELLKEAVICLHQGKPGEAEEKARKAVAIAPQALSDLRFDLDTYDSYPQIGRLMLFESIEKHNANVQLLVDDQVNRVEGISIPGQSTDDRQRTFKSAARAVLQEHGFTDPIFFQKSDGSWVGLSSRPSLRPLGQASKLSSYEVLQAEMVMSTEGDVTLELSPHAWIGSDYALLGKPFQISSGITKERRELAVGLVQKASLTSQHK